MGVPIVFRRRHRGTTFLSLRRWGRLEGLPQYVYETILLYPSQVLVRIDVCGNGSRTVGDRECVGGKLVDFGGFCRKLSAA